MKRRVLSVAALALITGMASAADWPQWRGPDRTGISKETGVMQSFPQGGPKLLWTFDSAGLGYSGFAIVGNRLYSCGADEDRAKEFVFAIDVDTGKEVWRTPLKLLHPDPNFKSDMWGGGPRCTPTVDGDRIYVLGAQGDLACLETKTGNLVWQKNLIGDFGGKVMQIWGYSESPLIDGDRIICCPGGEDGTVAALKKSDGSLVWRSKDLTDNASYGSIVTTSAGGTRHYALMTADGCAGVRASDGKLLWKSDIGKHNIAVIPTPCVVDDLVYITNDYGAGCGVLKLSASGDGVQAEKIYANKTMQNHHGGVIVVDGHVFGSTGNANNRRTLPFICQNLKTGAVVWEEKSLEPSSIVAVGNRFFCYGQATGAVVCVAATSKGFEEHGKFKIPKTSKKRRASGGIWTHPVVANGKLYLRDQDLLFCFDVGADKAVD